MNFRRLALSILLPALVLPYAASQITVRTLAASAPAPVPPLVPYSGQIAGRTGQASATFLIFKDQTGGEPLFTESQTVALDDAGRYRVELGAASPSGLPSDLFATGEARWLEVQMAGQPAEPRVLLASVPYALKAADAATLGGLPASAFALAGSTGLVANATSAAITPDAATTVTTTGGTANQIAKFSGSNTIVNSTLYDNGTEVGIGTTTPSSTLTVDGTTTLDGTTYFNGQVFFNQTGTATAATGYPSQAFKFQGSAYNSSTKSVVYPRFGWQTEPTGNNTASPGGTLNLVATPGTPPLAETGFYINTNGTIHFAPGQTFSGAVVNAGSSFDLGGTPFAFGSQASSNAFLGFAGNASTTGTDNTGSGFGALIANTTGSENSASGSRALYFNTTGNRNTANGDLALNNNITGNFNTASGFGALFNNTSGDNNTASGIQALYTNFGDYNTANGSYALTSNTYGSGNTASGYQALYSNTTGPNNTASGQYALYSNTTGEENTASGYYALYSNTTGLDNTASGEGALGQNTTGQYNVGIGEGAGDTTDKSYVTGLYNTAVGSFSVFKTGSITNATAIGAFAEADQSNTLILGCTFGLNCPGAVSVGIGTTTPDNLLTVNGSADKPGGGSWGTYSDGRLKNVNGSFASGLNQVMQLRPIRYRYKPGNGMGIRDREEHIGVVAQEIQRVIPEAVTENGKGYLLVNNDPVIWSMVNAIKEQQREIELQQKLLRAQSVTMRSLEAEVRETRKTLRQVKAQAAAGQLTLVAAK